MVLGIVLVLAGVALILAIPRIEKWLDKRESDKRIMDTIGY